MYYIIYGFLYLLSLLPFFILYALSDIAFFFLYFIFGYRQKVVFANLDIAFPQKTNAEKKMIAKKFYRNFTDTFIEAIKLLSISNKQFVKRTQMDVGTVQEYMKQGRNVQFHLAHQMNWEYAHRTMALRLGYPLVSIYLKIINRSLDRLFYKIRSVGSATMVAVQDVKGRGPEVFRKQYALGLIADQNPPMPAVSYWLNFFGKAAPFATGPDKMARANDTVVFFCTLKKLQRGYYTVSFTLITEHAAEMKEGELTLRYRDFLERCITENPDNYLWSHRRWKWTYNSRYKKRWLDKTPPPEEGNQ